MSSYTRPMAANLAEYVHSGYSLSATERLQAARLLRLSVDQDANVDQAEIDAAWEAEISSRAHEIVRGDIRLVDADETYRMLSAELAAKRE